MELFFETTTTNLMFNKIYSNINSMDNLICHDIGVHSIFDHNPLLLNLSKFNNILNLISSIYIGSYSLSVNYLESLSILEYMLSTKILMVQEKWPPYNNTQVDIQYLTNWKRDICICPWPFYFALREFLLVYLKQPCYYNKEQ